MIPPMGPAEAGLSQAWSLVSASPDSLVPLQLSAPSFPVLLFSPDLFCPLSPLALRLLLPC